MSSPYESTTETCWLCLDDGADENGEPLMRNCACRGDSGWAHVACLANFAKVQSKAMTVVDFTGLLVHGFRGTAFSECHTCKHPYHGGLQLSLAQAWVDAVADLDDAAPQRIAAALYYATASAEQHKYDAVRQTCEDLLRVLQCNVPAQDEADFFLQYQCVTTILLIQAYLTLGNQEQARHYSQRLKSLQGQVGFISAGINQMLEHMLAIFDGRMAKEENNDQDGLDLAMHLYNNSVKVEGKDSLNAIKFASNIGTKLATMGKWIEAHSWFKEAHDRGKRVFGIYNPDFINIKRHFLILHVSCAPRKGTLVTTDNRMNGEEVTILRATKDGNKYVVEYGQGQKLKVTPAQLVLATNTLVNVDNGDGVFPSFIDSFDPSTGSYRVFAMGGIERDDKYAYPEFSKEKVSVIFLRGNVKTAELFVDPSILSQLNK